MKKICLLILVIVLVVSCIALYGCNNYETTELTIDNYLDYFEWNYGRKIEQKGNSFVAKNIGDNSVSVELKLKDDKIENYYYENVIVEFRVNLYYGVSSIDENSIPDYTRKVEAKLVYTKSIDQPINYGADIGLISGICWYTVKSDLGIDTNEDFEIELLAEDFAFNDNAFTNYYREFEFVSISGTVKSGGLTKMNDYSCD